MDVAGGSLVAKRPEIHPEPADRRIARIAARQENVIGHGQLLALGLGRGAIRGRIQAGRLHPIFPRAYLVGAPVPSETARNIAAVLSTEPSLLSHRSAGQRHGFLPALAGPVHVTVAHGRALRRDGIVVHRTRHLHPDERWLRGPIAITSPARTLVDVAGMLTERELTRAYDEANRLGLVPVRAVLAACDRSGRKPGVALLRALATEPPIPASQARSPLEVRFLRFCRTRGLPPPAVNVPVLEYEVDCLWPEAKIIVELDGGTHRGRLSFEADRERDARLAVAGFLVYRLTERRLNVDPDRVERELRAPRAHRLADGGPAAAAPHLR